MASYLGLEVTFHLGIIMMIKFLKHKQLTICVQNALIRSEREANTWIHVFFSGRYSNEKY